MSSFVTRVELHSATGEDYSLLHQSMTSQGFSRTIVGSDGKRYQLPTAEYHYAGPVTKEDVSGKAAKAAQTVKKGFAILVSKYESCCWVGLLLAA